MPGMAVLSPIPTGNSAADAFPFIRSPEKNYTYGEWADVLRDAGRDMTLSVWDATRPLLINVSEAPGVRMWCMYGTNVSTVNGVNYKVSGRQMAESFSPELIYGNGDGTVHHASLAVCDDWTEKKYKFVTQNNQADSALAVGASFLTKLKSYGEGWAAGFLHSAELNNFVSAHNYRNVTHTGMLADKDSILDMTGFLGEIILHDNIERLIDVMDLLESEKSYAS